MDAYTLHLLGLAVEATSGYFDISPRASGGWVAIGSLSRIYAEGFGPTLADALRALLRDLGVEPPERPSAERVAEAVGFYAMPEQRQTLTNLRDLYAREPLTVLALLEGGE